MGRALDMEKRQNELDRRLKLVEDAVEGLIHTSVKHVDLHESTKEVISEKPKKVSKVKKETASA